MLPGEVGRCWACPEEEAGCPQSSWGWLCRGELADFLPAEGKPFLWALGSIISTSSLLHGENRQQSLAGSWFHLPPFPAVASFLNQKRTLFPERALLAAPTCRSQGSWCSLWCPWQAGQEEGSEFLAGRVDRLFLHPVPTSDVGLRCIVPSLEGEGTSALSAVTGLSFVAEFLKISLPAPKPAQCPSSGSSAWPHEASHSSPHFKLGSLSGMGSWAQNALSLQLIFFFLLICECLEHTETSQVKFRWAGVIHPSPTQNRSRGRCEL